MSDFQELAQTLQMALKALLMYTSAHPRATASREALLAVLEAFLDENPTLHIATSGGKLFLDGVPFEGQGVHITATARVLAERQISGIIFSRGLTALEVQEVLELLILKPARIEERGGCGKILEEKDLPHVELGQVQYREVREGEGGTESSKGPAMRPATLPAVAPPPAEEPKPPMPSLDALQAMVEQWRHEFKELPRHIQGGGEGEAEGSGTAHLGFLGGSVASVGFGEGFPSALQMEGLRKPLLELPPGILLSVVAGLGTLPPSPGGLSLAFQALAPEAFAHATAELLAQSSGQGEGWGPLKDRLHEILQHSPSFQGLLASLEGELRRRGMGLENLHELVARLDWDTMGLDDQLRLVMDKDHLWKLSHDQRLDLLRKLLDGGRMEAFTALLERIIKALAEDDAALREMAARTLVGVAGWLASPGLPAECEGAMLQGLAAHFSWESHPQIHRATQEALGMAVTRMVERGEPGLAQAVLDELEGLCAFAQSSEGWRGEALAWLWERLAQPEALAKVLELLQTANSETLLTELIPYLEKAGIPAVRALVEVLGEEQDRKRRIRLVEVIRGLGDLASPVVQESLDSDKWYLVRNTLNILADLGDFGALKPSEACLAHEDGRVRRAAVRTVWKLGGPAAVPALMTAFGRADQETMLEIMFAFSQIRSREVIPLLGQFAADRRMPEKLRARAAETLGLIGDPGALPHLQELIRRKGRFITSAEPIEIRLAASRALLALGTPAARETLRALVAQEPRNNDRPLLQQVADQVQP